LYENYETGFENDVILLQSLILKLVHMLNQNTVYTAKSNPKISNKKTIESTLEYINNNLSDDLTLERLANSANFNSIYFHKLFKASTGKTLHEYVEEKRIKRSINLLISTDMTLTQIAYECGFSSQSYFSYVFKRKTGLTPREYEKKFQSKYEKTF